jgi:hypothetical protein
MNWFHLTCRRLGLMVHHMAQPLKGTRKQVVSRRVEEKKIDENLTLRRTTVEEIELRQNHRPN